MKFTPTISELGNAPGATIVRVHRPVHSRPFYAVSTGKGAREVLDEYLAKFGVIEGVYIVVFINALRAGPATAFRVTPHTDYGVTRL